MAASVLNQTSVVISNGHNKFILGVAAVEADRRGLLSCFIAAGYPTAAFRNLAAAFRLAKFARIRRLLARKESISDRAVYNLWLPEIINQFGILLSRKKRTRLAGEWIQDKALRVYGFQAKAVLHNAKASIYHYRSGYGRQSIALAKRKGMVTLCDHSIAHPATLEYLIQHGGQLPDQGVTGKLSTFWQGVHEDLVHADHILVNSAFVKETFTNQGWDTERIHVIYAGIDDEFLCDIPVSSPSTLSGGPLKLLFAGEFGSRKGAQILIKALSAISDIPWEIEIIGAIEPGIEPANPAFFADPRVRFVGTIPRLQLSRHMAEAEIFIFPSLAEGSARVIFMAMACRCYVITTANSGSVVENGRHGTIVPAGDALSLERAIRDAYANRVHLPQVGDSNSREILANYRQSNYGEKLIALYEKIRTA